MARVHARRSATGHASSGSPIRFGMALRGSAPGAPDAAEYPCPFTSGLARAHPGVEVERRLDILLPKEVTHQADRTRGVVQGDCSREVAELMRRDGDAQLSR